ncbi:isoamyl alcohol [Colletotrichum truncatum]|uniref:Isoamyl alcohol n=1 Tax=Colletotrichum truncatum TaxID=5467 RepID=A0ACC3ZL69_COLTU|nr:isoamyl alcohol [Colletotrichum truncatum]KAF6800068.1 isoamyl alcohol [Colletotrichum truncatum]
MVRSTLAGRLLAALLFATGAAAHAEGCGCSADGVKRVTYIVVEMPEQEPENFPSYSTITPTSTLQTVTKPAATADFNAQVAHVVEDIPAFEPVGVKPETLRPAENTTHTFGPSVPPNIDTKDPINIVPAKNISLYYSATETNDQGSINMTLALNNPAVILEQVDAIKTVVCDDDELTVSFSDAESFDEAVKDWSESEEGFILITNHLGNCDAEFERGFFLATGLKSNKDELSITVAASKEELANIAGECEMSFSSLPAATLSKRLTLDPSVSLSFAEGLANNTVIYSDGQYINVTADEAWFSSTITFSGYLKYNFWGFKLQALYFDLDTTFDSAVGISVDVAAAFSHELKYAPDELSYSLVSVPGLVQLGPGVAFAVGLDVDVSAAVGVTAGLSVALPAGNVHLDLLDSSKSSATGWEPKYSSYANITQAADVRVDASADLTVQLAIKLLGGLVDLSSGLTATPGFDNRFKLRGEQNLGIGGNFTSKPSDVIVEVPKDGLVCAEKNGVEFATDFYFNLNAFATKWWNADLYNTRVPLWDLCYSF